MQEKFDNLTATCQKAISDFTEEEGEVCLVLLSLSQATALD